MSILIISPEFPPELSGMGDYTFHLACHLQKLGCAITVLANRSQAPGKESLHNITVLREIQKWDSRAWPRIRSLLRSGTFNTVHIQYLNLTFNNFLFIHFLPFLIRMRFPKVKVAVTFHEFAAPWKRLTLLPLFLFSNALIVTNDDHFHKLKKILKKLFIKKHVYRIPLAANILPNRDGLKKRDAVREQLGVVPGETLLVRFGILHDLCVTSLGTLLENLKKLLEEKIRVKLLLVGKEEPAAKDALLEKIETLGLKDSVLFKTNASPELVSAYLYASDIGLGLYPDGVSEKRTAFLSLLAHGIPTIATQNGPLPAELIPGENILTVDLNGSPHQWAESIQQMIHNPALRQKIKTGGDHVSSLHQWERIAENTAVLYRQMENPH